MINNDTITFIDRFSIFFILLFTAGPIFSFCDRVYCPYQPGILTTKLTRNQPFLHEINIEANFSPIITTIPVIICKYHVEVKFYMN